MLHKQNCRFFNIPKSKVFSSCFWVLCHVYCSVPNKKITSKHAFPSWLASKGCNFSWLSILWALKQFCRILNAATLMFRLAVFILILQNCWDLTKSCESIEPWQMWHKFCFNLYHPTQVNNHLATLLCILYFSLFPYMSCLFLCPLSFAWTSTPSPFCQDNCILEHLSIGFHCLYGKTGLRSPAAWGSVANAALLLPSEAPTSALLRWGK